ncbi:hypothetical protein SRABI70_04685 [Pseudomonas sp. Bi70]|nr:hypothetical protein SRABI70_04685 [Pseudomonas sp. Bi70]
MGAPGQGAHLVGDHREAAALVTGASGFDGGVERQQVGLFGHRANHLQHAADPPTLLIQRLHGLGRLLDLLGQLADLADGLLHHLVALLGLAVGIGGGQGGLFGVLRHFLHGGGHLVHGGGGLLGLHLLGLYTGTGLGGDRRQLFGRRGNLPHAVANPPNQVTQAAGHALHGLKQLAQLVTAVLGQILAQVAAGDTPGEFDGLAQRRGDGAADGEGGEQADQYRSEAHAAEQQHGVAAVLTHALLFDVLGLLGEYQYLIGLLEHGGVAGQGLLVHLLEIGECLLVVGQRHQGCLDGAFLIIIEPDHQAIGRGLQVVADEIPVFQRCGRAIDDETAFMATQFEHAFAEVGGGFGQGQRVAAAQLITGQAQFPYGVIHIQLDHLELAARLLGGIVHLLARLVGTCLMLHAGIELLQVVGGGHVHGLQALALGRRGSGDLLDKPGVHLGELLAHTLGIGFAVADRIVALHAPGAENLRVDGRQRYRLGVAFHHRLHGDEPAGRHGNGQQQYQAKTDQKFLADGKVDEQSSGRMQHPSGSFYFYGLRCAGCFVTARPMASDS